MHRLNLADRRLGIGRVDVRGHCCHFVQATGACVEKIGQPARTWRGWCGRDELCPGLCVDQVLHGGRSLLRRQDLLPVEGGVRLVEHLDVRRRVGRGDLGLGVGNGVFGHDDADLAVVQRGVAGTVLVDGEADPGAYPVALEEVEAIWPAGLGGGGAVEDNVAEIGRARVGAISRSLVELGIGVGVRARVCVGK